MLVRRIILALLLCCAAVACQGCVAAAVGVGAAGTMAYMKGDFKAVEAEHIDTVFAAAKNAVEDLDLTFNEERKDALTATIIAHDVQNDRVSIRLKRTTDKTTQIAIRVGTFGSQTKAQVIYQKIRENLSGTS